MQTRRAKCTYQLSMWVDDAKELHFMKHQLAEGGIPCEIRQREKNGKFALYRPDPTRYSGGQRPWEYD
jgi:hypothetical protein